MYRKAKSNDALPKQNSEERGEKSNLVSLSKTWTTLDKVKRINRTKSLIARTETRSRSAEKSK